MDGELKARISEIVRQLALQEQRRLRAAGTFVELEELACEIGDEVTRQLMAGQLDERCREAAGAPSRACPDCGRASTRSQFEHRELDSLRGKIEYDDPAYHCPTCRRDFFPVAGSMGLSARATATPKLIEKIVWAGSNLGSYAMAGEVHADDPCPFIPDDFVHASAVREIAKTAVNTGSNDSPPLSPEEAARTLAALVDDDEAARYEPPKLERRDVVASSRSSQEFGWRLEGERYLAAL